jgi:hypothetical protein
MQQLRQAQSTNLGRGCLIAFGLFWTLFSCSFTIIPLLIMATAFGSENDLSSFVFLGIFALFSLPFDLVGIGLIVVGIRPLIAGTRFSQPEITISTTTPRVGETIGFRYYQTLSHSTNVEQIKFKLVFRETATYRSGKHTHTVTQSTVVQEFTYPARQYEPGESINVSRELTIPADAMHTFVGTHNKLRWFIVPEIKIQNWPDYAEEYEIKVVPEVRM